MRLADLGRRIRDRRERCGLKQSDVAHALQISAQAVSKWERGENAPDLAILPDLCRLLGASADWLLGRCAADGDTFPATVLCSDLTGFAARARRLAPRDLAAWINGIFHLITEAVLRHEGVPVKYVGDGFLGFFSGARHADRAFAAAREARTVLPHARVGIALHSGPIFLGAIGHRGYARPDILGETVNTAFLLLPWIARRGRTGLGLTAATADLLEEKPGLGRPRRAALAGAREPVILYEPQARRAGRAN